MGPSGPQRRPASYWRHVHYTEVRDAVLDLLLIYDSTPPQERRTLASLATDTIEPLRRTLTRTADLDEHTDLTPPKRRNHDVEKRREQIPATAPARERAYALYDACLDFLNVFIGAGTHDPPARLIWDRAGRQIRHAILNAPFDRSPHAFGPSAASEPDPNSPD